MAAQLFDCERYLATDLIDALARVRLASPLVLQVLVPGRPECRAHYQLGHGEVTAKPGFAPAADVTLSIQAPELEQLAKGELDLEEAVTLERLQVFGARPAVSAFQLALLRVVHREVR